MYVPDFESGTWSCDRYKRICGREFAKENNAGRGHFDFACLGRSRMGCKIENTRLTGFVRQIQVLVAGSPFLQ